MMPRVAPFIYKSLALRLSPLRSGVCITRPVMQYTRPALISRRGFASKTNADIAIEDITELYATARDEFEIAMEETEKATVYAEEDRKAAREELEKVQAAFKTIVEGQDRQLAEEVSKRIGQRIRELEQGVNRMDEIAMEHD